MIRQSLMKLKNHKHFFAGTSNVVLPVPNKAHYPEAYQDKSRLCYYASLFNSVEINSSFYKIPMPRTVARWVMEVPAHFRFSFKLWKGITHAKGLDYSPADLDRFMTAIAPAAQSCCLLIQFPASLTALYRARLEQLLAGIRKFQPDGPLAIEFRHRSWYTGKIYQLLEQYKAAVVIHDMPQSATPDIDMDTDLAYLRFHGEDGKYRGSYDDSFLQEYAGYIKDWLKKGKTVYAYFNNTIGDAVRNLISLNNM